MGNRPFFLKGGKRMILRDELTVWLNKTLRPEDFLDDFCYNGLQLEGKEIIEKIVFGVSFNQLFLEKAISSGADAMIVHHGVFGRDLFHLHGLFKEKVHTMLNAGISLYGYHLPLDAHPEAGNNAQLIFMVNGEMAEPFEVGYLANLSGELTLAQCLERWHFALNPNREEHFRQSDGELALRERFAFRYYPFGPERPRRIAVVSGGASKLFEAALNFGADTFVCGDIQEYTAAMAYERGANFVNLGHYWSEKAGILALMEKINEQFPVECEFLDVENVI
jgi:dinuclear metal center YbgI/SA1388 family protein